MRLRSLLPLFLCLLLGTWPAAPQSSASSETSDLSSSLWQMLLEQTGALPAAISDYSSNWMGQLKQSQDRVSSLEQTNRELQSSSDEKQQTIDSLQASNSRLTQRNAGLEISLAASQKEAATSKAELAQSQRDLLDSSQSTTKAQLKVAELGGTQVILKIGCVLAAAEAVYIVLHLTGVLK